MVLSSTVRADSAKTGDGARPGTVPGLTTVETTKDDTMGLFDGDFLAGATTSGSTFWFRTWWLRELEVS